MVYSTLPVQLPPSGIFSFRILTLRDGGGRYELGLPRVALLTRRAQRAYRLGSRVGAGSSGTRMRRRFQPCAQDCQRLPYSASLLPAQPVGLLQLAGAIQPVFLLPDSRSSNRYTF